MRFGFHAYHESLRDKFSDHKRIYTLLTILFASAVIGVSYQFLNNANIITFARDTSIKPVPENYSAPLTGNSQNRKSSLEVIGFLPAWSVGNKVKVYPEYLDQIIYFGFGIDAEGNIITKDENGDYVFEWNAFVSPYFKEIRDNAHKTDTKVLVSIKSFDNRTIESIIGTPTFKKHAIQQIKELVKEHDLDGVNIDFEYFSTKDSSLMTQHSRFFQDLSAELKTLRSDMIVSADVNATVVYRDNAYDMVKIGDSIDQVIIMGYDYHWPESQNAGAVAPIDSPEDAPSIRKTIDSLGGRVSKDKIVLGIPLYGYEWQTTTEEKNSDTIPDTGAAATYSRVRELIQSRNDLEFHYDELAQSPWLIYKQNGYIKQMYYEDEKSLLRKLQYADSQNLDGVALWALGYEGNYIEPWEIIKEHTRGN